MDQKTLEYIGSTLHKLMEADAETKKRIYGKLQHIRKKLAENRSAAAQKAPILDQDFLEEK